MDVGVGEIEIARSTVPVKPSRGATVTVDILALPASTLTVVGVIEIE